MNAPVLFCGLPGAAATRVSNQLGALVWTSIDGLNSRRSSIPALTRRENQRAMRVGVVWARNLHLWAEFDNINIPFYKTKSSSGLNQRDLIFTNRFAPPEIDQNTTNVAVMALFLKEGANTVCKLFRKRSICISTKM